MHIVLGIAQYQDIAALAASQAGLAPCSGSNEAEAPDTKPAQQVPTPNAGAAIST